MVNPAFVLVTPPLRVMPLTFAASQVGACTTGCKSVAPSAHIEASAAAAWIAPAGVTSGSTPGHALCCTAWPMQRFPAMFCPVCVSTRRCVLRVDWIWPAKIELRVKPLRLVQLPRTAAGGGAPIDPC